MRIIVICSMLLIGFSAHAKEIAGVLVQETVQTESGVTLNLNGAGIRKKFFMDIYLAELYLEKQGNTTEEIINYPGQKRLVMHILYKEIPLDKLVEGWNDGFNNNTSKTILQSLQSRIDEFNSMFTAVTKDQEIIFDYLPEQGTKVRIAGQDKGIIPGKDFNDALLAIWLGEKPVTKKLKKDLLNSSD